MHQESKLTDSWPEPCKRYLTDAMFTQDPWPCDQCSWSRAADPIAWYVPSLNALRSGMCILLQDCTETASCLLSIIFSQHQSANEQAIARGLDSVRSKNA